ncbi:Toluene efflux pump outer membrane protein TtgI precursor [Planctomycetes bacterium CA13]|uniref:Toluene efflux pump outer membrane protein TtgI n=2 Tax=Novipirellula herctigrandis TaxID=2527986 RepID=A0A5C5YPB1_9BACT|nr:Toluene efflux pump outer membrane protein TtgI precursor [Planctomycetes bacterium CA13]
MPRGVAAALTEAKRLGGAVAIAVIVGVVAITARTGAAQYPMHEPIDSRVQALQERTNNHFSVSLGSYRERAANLPDAVLGTTSDLSQMVAVPPMWWEPSMSTSLGLAPQTQPIDIHTLITIALSSSPYVQSILTEPEIRRTEITIADAEFDSIGFVESKFVDTNDPVGSALTTGDSSSRFKDETLIGGVGMRTKTRAGGQFEMAQRAGYQENNSTFLIPNPQGTTRLEFSFTQPLMKDRGRAFNQTRIVLAQLDVKQTSSEVRANLERHLVEVAQAYWELYQARAEWLQRNRLLASAEELHLVLVSRSGIDSHQRQVLRASTAVASRRSDLVRAESRIRNTQSRLRMLTGSSVLMHAHLQELAPQDQPFMMPVDLSVRQSVLTALEYRADINQSIRRIQSMSVRVGAAKNQVLPRLDLILSSYVAGLDGNRSSLQAFENQFNGGTPSYAAGILFELPVANRASRARLTRNRLELSRAMYEFKQATEVAFTEVEIAARETQTAFEEMLVKNQSIDAQNREVAYLKQRWELLPDPNESAVVLIDDLLDAQERLADEERAFVTAQVSYALSWVNLRKAMGILLQFGDLSEPASEVIESEPVEFEEEPLP